MPGLFGMARLDPRAPLDRGPASQILDDMGERLQHLGQERMDVWADWRGGVVVARVGMPHLLYDAWPDPPAASGGGQRRRQPGPAKRFDFIDGVLHEDVPRPEDLRHEANLSDAEMARRLEGFWSAVFYRPAGPKSGGGRGGASGRGLTLAVDRRCQRPLCYAVHDGTLYFAPEVKALLAVPGLDREVDPGALGLFFASGFLLANQTFFPQIRRLEGGTLLHLEGDEPRLERYADYRFEPGGDGTPYSEIRRQLAVQMRRSVERNYEDPEKDWIFLSGGKDSRLILSSAVDSVADPSLVHAVSWTSNDPQPGSDVHLAREIAAHLGVTHHEVRRTPEDFAEKALRLTYILDGLTDVGAYHGDELRIMEDLARDGVGKVLRGDQCFTRGRAMASPAYAILRMCIRSTSGLSDGRSAWRPDSYQRICEAGDAVLRTLEEEYADVEENNAGDQVYFRHRLQGYLNSAVYFKHLMLDHRNPLLDEGLLRLIQRLSVDARREQRVLNEAGSLYFGDVWNPFPFAERSNLEDFTDLLSRDTPVRRAVRQQLEDNDSLAWEFLDRRQLLARLDGLGSSGGSSSLASRMKKKVKTVIAKAVYNIPAVDTRLRGVYLERITRHDEVLLRALTLKHVFDLFVTGDGSRSNFEARREALREGVARQRTGPPRSVAVDLGPADSPVVGSEDGAARGGAAGEARARASLAVESETGAGDGDASDA